MNVTELRASIQPFFSTEVSIVVYAIVKDGEGSTVAKLDIEAESQGELKGMLLESVREKIIERPDLAVLLLSAADERSNAIYQYDLQIPSELEILEHISESTELPLLNSRDTSLVSVRALVFEIGNSSRQLLLYKTMAPVNVFRKDSFFLIKSRTRFKKIDEEFLRISPGFQLIRISGALFVLDLSVLERSFGFHEVIKREAEKGVRAIAQMNLVENPDALQGQIEDVRFARRLAKVAHSSPLIRRGVENGRIIQFCRDFPALSGKFRLNPSGDKILLDTHVSKELLIKLLMDSYLTSELTRLHYESLAKDSLDENGQPTSDE